jgi:hypothetical protein
LSESADGALPADAGASVVEHAVVKSIVKIAAINRIDVFFITSLLSFAGNKSPAWRHNNGIVKTD